MAVVQVVIYGEDGEKVWSGYEGTRIEPPLPPGNYSVAARNVDVSVPIAPLLSDGPTVECWGCGSWLDVGAAFWKDEHWVGECCDTPPSDAYAYGTVKQPQGVVFHVPDRVTAGYLFRIQGPPFSWVVTA